MTVVLRPARVTDLPTVYRAEPAHIRNVEPGAEPACSAGEDGDQLLFTRAGRGLPHG